MNYNIGDCVFGNWTITRELGQGTYGKVFEVKKSEFGLTVVSAMKVMTIPHSQTEVKTAMSEGMDGESLTRYFEGIVQNVLREIQTMSSFKGCENIVHYEDHCVIPHEGELGWDILIRMELLTPFLDYVNSHDMPEEDVVRLGIELLRAIKFCHSKDVVHRDIKPENVFLNETGTFKLGDFGESRTMEKTIGATKRGTESYMAPEVYMGKQYNKNVDIYSLGIMLYRLMNGNRLPFYPLPPSPISYTDRDKALERRLRGDQLEKPAYASEEFSKIILKACAYNPEERYSSAEEMLKEMLRLQKGYDTGQILESRQDEVVEMISQEQTTGVFTASKDIVTENISTEQTTGVFATGKTIAEEKISTEQTTGVFTTGKTIAEEKISTEQTTGVFSADKISIEKKALNEVEHNSVVAEDETDVVTETRMKFSAYFKNNAPVYLKIMYYVGLVVTLVVTAVVVPSMWWSLSMEDIIIVVIGIVLPLIIGTVAIGLKNGIVSVIVTIYEICFVVIVIVFKYSYRMNYYMYAIYCTHMGGADKTIPFFIVIILGMIISTIAIFKSRRDYRAFLELNKS